MRGSAARVQRNDDGAQRRAVSHGQKQICAACANDDWTGETDDAGTFLSQISGRQTDMRDGRERDGAGGLQLPERSAL